MDGPLRSTITSVSGAVLISLAPHLNPASSLAGHRTVTCEVVADGVISALRALHALPRQSPLQILILVLQRQTLIDPFHCDAVTPAACFSLSFLGPSSFKADLLERYGGVAPKMAEEAHSQVIDQVVNQALENAKLTEKDLSAVAVTIGPGLSLCLRVGVQKARKIAGHFNLPIIGVHHMEAHALVASVLMILIIDIFLSGGHNLLILAHELGHYLQLGTTIDDAIGEAYDKTARWLGLDLRKGGGPALEELAREGDANSVKFSIPMRQHKDCNFSYAGLKTQVRLAIESTNM
ncbi:hypothetical protein Taro_037141 [Colocasia esculenta]|uniref:N(6)-L-threonylcarbamoyladenine synthase n=1 Tax=Colocasia esculenta TaxID=4460 RepID=A0A843W4Y0_COLES|nr:hypothetical protein [Colocasia esculenta]